MIPIRLELTNFLSYRETAELDLRGIHLATISGLNGAGKSSILDAITWALFGKNRSKSDDDVVNRTAARNGDTAQVVLDFMLEKVVYRVIRRKKAGRTMVVEFQVAADAEAKEWKSLTMARRRETDNVIEELLRMNYDTFTNASFLLQGKADEFTTKTAGQRKEILADLLGVSQWEQYREVAAAERKKQESRLTLLDAQLGDIETELAEEPERQANLERARAEHTLIKQQLAAQERTLTEVRRSAEIVEQQKRQVQEAKSNLARAERRLQEWEEMLNKQRAERAGLAALLAEEAAIKAAFAAWEGAQAAMDAHQARATEFSRLQQAMRPHEVAIAKARSSLQQRKADLERQQARVGRSQEERGRMAAAQKVAQKQLEGVIEQLAALAAHQEQIAKLQQSFSGLEAEQPLLKKQMDALKERIDKLNDSTGGICPLCGQPLTESHRVEVVADLADSGKEMADQYRRNQRELPALQAQIVELERAVRGRAQLERLQQTEQGKMLAAEAQLKQLDQTLAEWETEGAAELAAVSEQLERGEYAAEAQAELAALEAAVAAVGYDEAAHRKASAERDGLREAPQRLQKWEQAATKVTMLEENLAALEKQIAEQRGLVEEQQQGLQTAESLLATLTADGDSDLVTLEKEVHRLREAETEANRRVGRGEQLIKALEDQRARRAGLHKERAELTLLIQRLQLLEKACSKNGVQALLIERSLPDIEERANELLERLTDGRMRVEFETQREAKSKKESTIETLDIAIVDEVGVRPYENYSGGEQFRVNFAIRIALSQILAQRAGARLQTLVIDEGFGSQDPDGRQRLIGAINAIKDDFKLILIITHIAELRDVFPTRIEVLKTPQGSKIEVIS